jgi:hypothetical protein
MPSGKKDSVAPTLFRTIAASGGEFAHLAVRPPGGSRIVSNGAANKPLIISSRTNNQDPR